MKPKNGRDNARTPMQWSADEPAGFTSGTLWIGVNLNHAEINVETDRADPQSIYAYYRRLIAPRKSKPLVVHGKYWPFATENSSVCAFSREHDGDRLCLAASFTEKPGVFDVPEGLTIAGECLISNYAARNELSGRLQLQPYEVLIVIHETSQPSGR